MARSFRYTDFLHDRCIWLEPIKIQIRRPTDDYSRFITNEYRSQDRCRRRCCHDGCCLLQAGFRSGLRPGFFRCRVCRCLRSGFFRRRFHGRFLRRRFRCCLRSGFFCRCFRCRLCSGFLRCCFFFRRCEVISAVWPLHTALQPERKALASDPVRPGFFVAFRHRRRKSARAGSWALWRYFSIKSIAYWQKAFYPP